MQVPQFLAAEPQYVHHLGPVWAALGGEAGCWYVHEAAGRAWTALGAQAQRWTGRVAGPVVVAASQDVARARRAGARIALMEHGVGQSYAGDPRLARHPSYAGGDGADRVSLILAPNEHSAARWRSRYPTVAVRVIGATRVLTPPEDPRVPLLAVSFHWPGSIPEQRTTLPWYAPHLASLAARLPVIGHSHPRYESACRRAFDRAGIEYVADLGEVARRATVYAVDNSSTLWEMALHRPVIALNAPWYRRAVHHGLRFWSHVPGPQADDGAALEAHAARLLAGGETPAEYQHRAEVVAGVLTRLDGAREGARLISAWAEGA